MIYNIQPKKKKKLIKNLKYILKIIKKKTYIRIRKT